MLLFLDGICIESTHGNKVRFRRVNATDGIEIHARNQVGYD
jgi:hypothetical protein